MKQIWFTSFVVASLLGSCLGSDYEARAIIESIDQTTLSSQLAGRIIELPKNDGDYFKKDELLIKLDCDVYEAIMNKAKVSSDLAKVKLEKNKDLEKLNSVGKFDVITSDLEYQKDYLEYQIAKLNVDRCEIRAPYDGRVVLRKASRFQTIKPQDELIEIINSNSYEARIISSSSWLSWLKVGQTFKLYVDELRTNVSATVKQIDAVVDPRSQTISFRATINSKDILAGMSATARFNRK